MHGIPLEPLDTTDRNGQPHRYWCLVEDDPTRWTVSVWETYSTSGEYYEATFEFLDDYLLKSTSLHNHGQPWAMRKGISEAVFDLVHERSGCAIVSSRTCREGEGEWRTLLATGMWERFVKSGLAERLPDLDHFVYPADAKNLAVSILNGRGADEAR